MVYARERTREAVLDALAAGRSYASTGPRIRSVSLDGDVLHVATTPARSIAVLAQPPIGARVNAGHHEIAYFGQRLTTGDAHGLEGQIEGDLLTEANFPGLTSAQNHRYLRIVVQDAAGRTAWSNPIWLG